MYPSPPGVRVRGLVVPLIILTLLLVASGLVAAPIRSPGPPAPWLAVDAAGGLPRPAAPLSVDSALLFAHSNLTLPNPAAGSKAPPTSIYDETPPPSVPATTPTVVHITANLTTCCVTDLFTPPPGPYGAVVFNYTGTVVGDVYDSSYRAYVDGVQFLEGTTPEYGTWTVNEDLSEYASLFHGTVNLTYLLGAATLGGHFVTNLTLSFYPVAPGAAPPPAPTEIIPLWAWNHTYLHQPSAVLYANATVPANVTNATLQLFVYGFGPQDEFWYSSQPSYREAFVRVDGRVLAAVLPFPYINTGGVDLFLWRPLPGAFTTDDRPYEIDVTGSLGLLEGYHNYTANVSGMNSTSGNTWLVGGALLLYTSPSTGAAKLTEYDYRPGTVSHRGSSTYDDSAAAQTLVTASTLTVAGSSQNVTTDLTDTFTDDQTMASTGTSTTVHFTQNLTLEALLATASWTNDSAGTTTRLHSTVFPLTFDESGTQTVVSESGDSETVNFTNIINGYHQEWWELDAAGSGLDPQTSGAVVRVDDVTTAAGSYGGQETVSSGGGATLDSLSGADSATSKSFSYAALGVPLPVSYEHELSAAGDNPPGPYNAETVLTNVVLDPLVASASVADALLTQGQTLSFSVRAAGGAGGYSYSWAGLPAGCTSANTASLNCLPSANGTFLPAVTVTDADGNATTVSPGVVTIFPQLQVAIVPSRSAWDAGQSLPVSAVVTGGNGFALSCLWSVDNQTQGVPQPCSESFELNASGSASTSETVSVRASQASGANASSAELTLAVAQPPYVTLAQTSPASAAHVGGYVELAAAPFLGTAPYSFTWSINGTNQSGQTGALFVLVPTGRGDLSITVWITDAAGLSAESGVVTVDVGAAPSTGSGSSGSGSGGTTVDETGWYAALVIAAVTIPLILFLALRTPPPPPRPPPGRGGPPPARRGPPPRAPPPPPVAP